MKNPPHPGGLVLRQCIEPLSLTMAARLSKVSRGSAESWLSQQAPYDLARVRAGASSSSGWHCFSQFQGWSFAEGSRPRALFNESYKSQKEVTLAGE